jgi:hypothetical protein
MSSPGTNWTRPSALGSPAELEAIAGSSIAGASSFIHAGSMLSSS